MENGDGLNQPSAPSTDWTKQRESIHAWLVQYSPALAEQYKAAVRIFSDRQFPARLRLICHCVREIRNRLPDAIAGVQKRSRVEYAQRLEDLRKELAESGLSFPSLGGPQLPGQQIEMVSVPSGPLRSLLRLIEDHSSAYETHDNSVVRLFEALAPENKKQRETLVPIVKEWKGLTSWFLKYVHESLGPVDVQEDELVKKFQLFEDSMIVFAKTFYETVDELDEILEDTN